MSRRFAVVAVVGAALVAGVWAADDKPEPGKAGAGQSAAQK